ncbi:MAG: hypothetical protein H0U76_23205 [Ktedonobacteraceae bacterium]|nr:hypothetical protein [Ktedonobacteraceae bacterium]
MLSQSPTTFTATNRYSLVDRVLRLRRQIGIDIPLSVSDLEDTFPSAIERELSIETPKHTSPAYDRRDWLAWSQSPGGRNLPEKRQEEL